MNIGIVTICFNQARFLREALRSVEVASRHKLEYVVVDAGSTDGSRQIIEDHRSKLADVVLEPDRGPADGLNKGFSRLKRAEICGYINADDRFARGALDYVCGFFERNAAAELLFGSIQTIDHSGKRNLRGRRVNRVTAARYAEGTCSIWQQATFFRRSAFARTSGFNVENRISWDAELAIDMLLSGARAYHTTKALGDFRMYKESITGSGKYQQLADQEHERLCRRIYAAGFGARRPWISRTARAINKINPARHLGNVLVGLEPRSADFLRCASHLSGVWRF